METFSPDTGSMTGLSTTACFKNTLPRVARKIILSKAIDFSLNTRPLMKPSLTCFEVSVDISFRTSKR